MADDIGTQFGSPFGQEGGRTLGDLVSIILSNSLVIAGIILLFLFVLGGIGIISGAGSDNPERMTKGKQAVTSAIVGFIIVFAAYWIIQLVEAITGVPILKPGI